MDVDQFREKLRTDLAEEDRTYGKCAACREQIPPLPLQASRQAAERAQRSGGRRR